MWRYALLFILIIVAPLNAQESGNRLAFIANAGGVASLYVWNSEALSLVQENVTRLPASAWSNDGRLAFLEGVADVFDYSLFVWDGQTVELLPEQARPDYGEPVWSQDGRLAFTAGIAGTRRVLVWDGETFIDVLPEADYSGYPQWSADGRLAFEAFINEQNEVFIWDGSSATNISEHEAHDESPVWSTDGRIAFISYRDSVGQGDDLNREVYLWDDGSLSNLSQSLEDDKPLLRWSANGQHLFWFAGLDTLMLWDGTEILSFQAQREAVLSADGNLAFSSPGDNHLFIYSDELLEIGEIYPFLEPALAWSTDGVLAYTGSRTISNAMGEFQLPEIYLWENGESRLLADAYSPVWSADNRLAYLRNTNIGGTDTDSFDSLLVWDGTIETVIHEAVAMHHSLVWEN